LCSLFGIGLSMDTLDFGSDQASKVLPIWDTHHSDTGTLGVSHRVPARYEQYSIGSSDLFSWHPKVCFLPLLFGRLPTPQTIGFRSLDCISTQQKAGYTLFEKNI
jgi:hypothetical protein